MKSRPDDHQVELFRRSDPDVPYREVPTLPAHAPRSATSRAAAASQLPRLAESLRDYLDVMRAHRQTGGLTDHEAAAILHRPLSSIPARRSDARKAGFTIIDTEATRETPFGGRATVWLLIEERREIDS